MSDKKRVIINPAYMESTVSRGGRSLEFELHDGYRESRKEQIVYVLKDLDPWMVVHLIAELSKGLIRQQAKINKRFDAALEGAKIAIEFNQENPS